MNANIIRRIVTPVLSAGFIGAAALGLAGVANAAAVVPAARHRGRAADQGAARHERQPRLLVAPAPPVAARSDLRGRLPPARRITEDARALPAPAGRAVCRCGHQGFLADGFSRRVTTV